MAKEQVLEKKESSEIYYSGNREPDDKGFPS